MDLQCGSKLYMPNTMSLFIFSDYMDLQCASILYMPNTMKLFIFSDYMDLQCGRTLFMPKTYQQSLRLMLTSNYEYRENMKCVFTLNTTSDEELIFYFRDINIEPSSSCSDDWLELHEGKSANSNYVSGKLFAV